MKKLISLLLAIVMIFGTFTLSTYAANSEEVAEPVQENRGKLADYVFKSYSEAEAAAIADAIVASSPEHWVTTSENGDIMYCVSICISDNPELGNAVILRTTSEKLIDKTVEMCVLQGIDPTLFDHNHFTGELALHVLAMLVMESLHESLWPNYASYYEIFHRADMNPDEQRLPPALMKMVGILILGLF